MEKIEAGLSEMVTANNMPKQTRAQDYPVCVDSGGSTETRETDQSSSRTMPATTAEKVEIRPKRRDEIKRRKEANVLMFRFQNGRKLRKIFVRGKKLLSILSNKNVHVAGAKFKRPELLPSGSLFASRFTLSVVCQQSLSGWQRCQTVHNRKPNQSQWIEMERKRMKSQRNSTPKPSVKQLQRKLAWELDSSADSSSGLSLEYSKSNSLAASNKSNTKQRNLISRNSTAETDDIDDIFGALDDLK